MCVPILLRTRFIVGRIPIRTICKRSTQLLSGKPIQSIDGNFAETQSMYVYYVYNFPSVH